MALIVFPGMISILLFSLQFDAAKMTLGVIGSALATGGAASLTGALLGFLFGLPHSGQNVDTDGRGGGGASRTNTNLDQVSDWLTKLLVGVGLVQLGRAPKALGRLAANLSAGFGGVPQASAQFALAVVIYFAVCGFLMGYVWARLVLAKPLRDADLGGSTVVRGRGGSAMITDDGAAVITKDGSSAVVTEQGGAMVTKEGSAAVPEDGESPVK